MTRGIRLTGLLALALLAALVVLLSVDDTHAAPPPFEPGGTVCIENFESGAECDGDTSPGASSDIRSRFCVGWNDDCSVRDNPVVDSNFGGIVAFTPNEWGLPKGDTIPIGAIAGRLESEATLGLLNNFCGNRIQVAFTMLNASINLGDQISPKPEGETDVMEPLAMDTNNNGIPDGADQYPSFLAEFFDNLQPRARLFGITHIQGSWVTLNFVFFENTGVTIEVGQTVLTFDPALGYPSITILQDPTAQAAPGAITDFCAPLFSQNLTLGVTLNNPCSAKLAGEANCPTGEPGAPTVKEKGYPLFPCDPRNTVDEDGDGKVNDGCPQVGPTAETGAQCDNDISDDPEDSSANDGCPPVGDQSEGARLAGACSTEDEGGCIYRTNPTSAATVNFTTLVASQRDADGDGIENSLDVCALIPNADWKPREVDPVNDPDNDGLPSACDPKPNETGAGSPVGCKSGYTGADEDQDCFANRADNCPVDKSLDDPTKLPEPDTNKPKAPDEDSDGIGDVCDPNPDQVNGENISFCLKFAVAVGGASGPSVGTKDAEPGPDCAAGAPVSTPPPVTPQPGQPGQVTPRPTTATGPGVGGPGSAGVGSLSPTATGFPVWAAVLAGIGAAGVTGGLALYTRLAPRKQR